MNVPSGSIPKGCPRIAERFNVGWNVRRTRSPEGTAERGPASAVPYGTNRVRGDGPKVETLGYCRMSLRDKINPFVCAFIAFILCGVSYLAPASSLSSPREDRTSVILVIGAPGGDEYATNFLRRADHWQSASTRAGARLATIGVGPCPLTNDYAFLKQTLGDEPKEGSGQLWVVLIGHGTFDGKEAEFNLRGPDVSAAELSDWLRPFHRPMAVIDTTECSGPFLNKLSATNRVVITATRSGDEQSFTRFGQYFVEALTNPQADIDQDGQISVLEAFLTASHQTAEFYKLQGRLLTEHALLDDNGDGLGTPPDWFRGLRPIKKPEKGAADGLLAQQFRLIPSPDERNLTPEQMAQRDAVEKAVLSLREKKSQLAEDDYYRELEGLLLQLARFYNPGVTNSPAATK